MNDIVRNDIQNYRTTPENTVGLIEDDSSARAWQQIGNTFNTLFRGLSRSGQGSSKVEKDWDAYNEQISSIADQVAAGTLGGAQLEQALKQARVIGFNNNLTASDMKGVDSLHGLDNQGAYGKIIENFREQNASDQIAFDNALRAQAVGLFPADTPEVAQVKLQDYLNSNATLQGLTLLNQSEVNSGSETKATHNQIVTTAIQVVSQDIQSRMQQAGFKITREGLEAFKEQARNRLMEQGVPMADANLAVMYATYRLTSLSDIQMKDQKRLQEEIELSNKITKDAAERDFLNMSFSLGDGRTISGAELNLITGGFQNSTATNMLIGTHPDLIKSLSEGTRIDSETLRRLNGKEITAIWSDATRLIPQSAPANQMVAETIRNESEKQAQAPIESQGVSRAMGVKAANKILDQIQPEDTKDPEKRADWNDTIPSIIKQEVSGLAAELIRRGYDSKNNYPYMTEQGLKFYQGPLSESENQSIIDITDADNRSRALSSGSFLVKEDQGSILKLRQNAIRLGFMSGEEFDQMFNQEILNYFPQASQHDPSRVSSLAQTGNKTLAFVSDFVEGGANALGRVVSNSPKVIEQALGDLIYTASDKTEASMQEAERVAAERDLLNLDERIATPANAIPVGSEEQTTDLADIPLGTEARPSPEEIADMANRIHQAEASEALIGEDGPYNQKSLPNPVEGSKKTERFVKNDIVLTGKPGQEVKSPVTGVIAFAGKIRGKDVVLIQDTSIKTGKIWAFSELIPETLRRGDNIKEGQPIGSTNSKGAVRIALSDNQKRVDPSKYFK